MIKSIADFILSQFLIPKLFLIDFKNNKFCNQHSELSHSENGTRISSSDFRRRKTISDFLHFYKEPTLNEVSEQNGNGPTQNENTSSFTKKF